MDVDANALVTEAVVTSSEVVLGNAPAQSQGVTLESAAFSLSQLMMNAVSAQQAASQTANAAVASACAQLLRAASSES